MKKMIALALVCSMLLLAACQSQPSSAMDGEQGESTTVTTTSTSTTSASSEATTGSTSTTASTSTSTSKSYPSPTSTKGTTLSTSFATRPSSTNSTTTTTTTVEQPTYYEIPLEGTVVDVGNSETNGTYVVTRGTNKLIRLAMYQGYVLNSVDLPAEPFAMKVYYNDLWISFPELKQIRKYCLIGLEELEIIQFEHEICSFTRYIDNQLYYTTADRVYVGTVNGGAGVEIGAEYAPYQQPVVAAQHSIAICETGYSGCRAFTYNTKSQAITAVFDNGGEGCTNQLPRAFCDDGSLFWADFQLSDGNAAQVWSRYRVDTYSAMLFVNGSYVMTTDGLFDRPSGVQLLEFRTETSEGMAGFITEEGAMLLCAQTANGESFAYIYLPPREI